MAEAGNLQVRVVCPTSRGRSSNGGGANTLRDRRTGHWNRLLSCKYAPTCDLALTGIGVASIFRPSNTLLEILFFAHSWLSVRSGGSLQDAGRSLGPFKLCTERRQGMKPAHAIPVVNLSRGASWLCAALLLSAIGCANPLVRSQSPDETDLPENQVKLIGDVAAPYGMTYVKIEGVALVTTLANTGSDPQPSAQRTALIAEMQTRGVPNPNKVLGGTTTSLVWVRGWLPPGVQKGDHFDVEVRTPAQSETTSLRGGWLMETRLKEMQVLGGQVRDGHLLGLAQGPLLVDPAASERTDKVLLNQARVLGGGIALKARTLGLVLKPGEKSVHTSAQIGSALNRRFHTVFNGNKQGVANPQTDELIELALHPRYKDNIPRYMRVVRSVALFETQSQQIARLQQLEKQLVDPLTAATAALRLEAVGKDGVKILLQGLASEDAEVRFYSAEALAYLDDPAGAKRWVSPRTSRRSCAFALTALSTLNDVEAYDQLRELLDVPSAETRYGDFRRCGQ